MIKQIEERNLNKNDKTSLHIAVESDLITETELLISKGADINAKDIMSQIMKNHF